MIKNGRIETGKTPSVVSGKRSDRIENGEPVAGDEHPYDGNLKKAASQIEQEQEQENTEG